MKQSQTRKNKSFKKSFKNVKRNKTRKTNNKLKGGSRKVKTLKNISLDSLFETIDLSKINTYDDLNYLPLPEILKRELFNKIMFISIHDWNKLSKDLKKFYDNKTTFSKKDDDDNYININEYITETPPIPAQRYLKAREGFNTNTDFLNFKGEYIDGSVPLYIQVNELWRHPILYSKNEKQYIYYDITQIYQKLNDNTFILIFGDENKLFYKRKNFFFHGLSHKMTSEPGLTSLMTTVQKNINTMPQAPPSPNNTFQNLNDNVN